LCAARGGWPARPEAPPCSARSRADGRMAACRSSSPSTFSRRCHGSAWNNVTCAPTAVRPRGKSSARSASNRACAAGSSCSVTTNGRSSLEPSIT
jgi:hypothetical protein